MAYTYLLKLYEKLDFRIEEARTLIPEKRTSHEIQFLEGRIALLSEFKQFLIENMNEKLPRRIRKKISKQDR